MNQLVLRKSLTLELPHVEKIHFHFSESNFKAKNQLNLPGELLLLKTFSFLRSYYSFSRSRQFSKSSVRNVSFPHEAI